MKKVIFVSWCVRCVYRVGTVKELLKMFYLVRDMLRVHETSQRVGMFHTSQVVLIQQKQQSWVDVKFGNTSGCSTICAISPCSYWYAPGMQFCASTTICVVLLTALRFRTIFWLDESTLLKWSNLSIIIGRSNWPYPSLNKLTLY